MKITKLMNPCSSGDILSTNWDQEYISLKAVTLRSEQLSG